MSDDQQPEDLRPIPDGGLKDAIPGWLKRPPAWRNMPTAEQRHERTLPEPDTSEIDPKGLVDVSDLPQWLQIIAARGEVPLPEPDDAVEHAIEQVQAASRRDESDAHSYYPDTLGSRGADAGALPLTGDGADHQQRASSEAARPPIRDGASPDNKFDTRSSSFEFLSEQVTESGDDLARQSSEKREVGLLTDEPAANLPATPGASRPSYLVWSLFACGIVMAVLIVVILYLL